jgi:hypothetical protein
MRKMKKLTGTIQCVAVDGANVTIREYTEFIESANSLGHQWCPGFKELKTSDGHPVNSVPGSDAEFEVLKPFGSLRVRSVERSAKNGGFTVP